MIQDSINMVAQSIMYNIFKRLLIKKFIDTIVRITNKINGHLMKNWYQDKIKRMEQTCRKVYKMELRIKCENYSGICLASTG
jgi:hypothetical protein